MTNTPKHFALQLGALVSLYLSLSFLLVLVFGLINLSIPDSADSYWQITSAESSIRFGIAMVVVFFPTYLLLTRTINQIRRESEDAAYLLLTKWLIYLSLLLGGAVLLGDLVAVLNGFLEGELSSRFLLKAGAVLLTIGAAFYYYLRDAQGYWINHQTQSVAYGLGALAVVVILVGLGIGQSKLPAEVREQRLDQTQVEQLQDIQWRIEEAHRSDESLPSDLATIYAPAPIPTSPEGRSAYTYEVETDDTYQLCADFFADSIRDPYSRNYPQADKNYDWNYTAGTYCFERSVEAKIDEK